MGTGRLLLKFLIDSVYGLIFAVATASFGLGAGLFANFLVRVHADGTVVTGFHFLENFLFVVDMVGVVIYSLYALLLVVSEVGIAVVDVVKAARKRPKE